MSLAQQRRCALVFWALITVLVRILGTGPGAAWVVSALSIWLALEVFAFLQARRAGETAQSRWLVAASILTGFSAVLFVTPFLILEVFGDRVHACLAIEGGGNPCDFDQEGRVNLGFELLMMYLIGYATAVAALVAWTVYVVRTLRHRSSQAAQVSQT